jgi:Fe-S cluster biogenesis protein NfuA/nitrite reductase/ring-hydroxylating ferredoxin subunit
MAAESSTVESAGGVVDPERLIEHVQELTERLEAAGDAPTRAVAEQLMAAVMQMYGAGLERILEVVADAGAAGQPIQDALVQDGLVGSLLLIHDLYPVPLEERVRQALETVRPYMESHGGNVELLGISDGIVHLRLEGSCKTCSASSSTLELAVRQALEEAAPDLEGMEVEGVAEPEPTGATLPLAGNGAAAPGGFELPVVGSSPPSAPAWFDVGELGALEPEHMVAAEVAGTELVIANVDGTLLAYRDACASCGGALHDGELTAGALVCPSCSRGFFLPRAGRSLDDEHLMLEPIPLLREQGGVKVALAP